MQKKKINMLVFVALGALLVAGIGMTILNSSGSNKDVRDNSAPSTEISIVDGKDIPKVIEEYSSKSFKELDEYINNNNILKEDFKEILKLRNEKRVELNNKKYKNQKDDEYDYDEYYSDLLTEYMSRYNSNNESTYFSCTQQYIIDVKPIVDKYLKGKISKEEMETLVKEVMGTQTYDFMAISTQPEVEHNISMKTTNIQILEHEFKGELSIFDVSMELLPKVIDPQYFRTYVTYNKKSDTYKVKAVVLSADLYSH